MCVRGSVVVIVCERTTRSENRQVEFGRDSPGVWEVEQGRVARTNQPAAGNALPRRQGGRTPSRASGPRAPWKSRLFHPCPPQARPCGCHEKKMPQLACGRWRPRACTQGGKEKSHDPNHKRVGLTASIKCSVLLSKLPGFFEIVRSLLKLVHEFVAAGVGFRDAIVTNGDNIRHLTRYVREANEKE